MAEWEHPNQRGFPAAHAHGRSLRRHRARGRGAFLYR
jgi:hypothetical protein